MADHGLVYLPENRDAEGIISTMTIRDNIALTGIKDLSRFGFMRPPRERDGPTQIKTGTEYQG